VGNTWAKSCNGNLEDLDLINFKNIFKFNFFRGFNSKVRQMNDP